MGAEIKAGKKPYKLQLVGLELGGKPIEEYASRFLVNIKCGWWRSNWIYYITLVSPIKETKHCNGICPI
jgi:hypothetical protein